MTDPNWGCDMPNSQNPNCNRQAKLTPVPCVSSRESYDEVGKPFRHPAIPSDGNLEEVPGAFSSNDLAPDFWHTMHASHGGRNFTHEVEKCALHFCAQILGHFHECTCRKLLLQL